MSTELNMPESYFEKFSTTTVIRVFNFIRTASHLVERIFWILVFIGFTIVTVWDISQTIQRYLSEPTGSIVSFPATSDVGMNFSNAALCISMNEASLLKLYDNETLVDEIISAFVSTPDITQQLREKLEKFHTMHAELARMHSLSNRNESARHESLIAYYDSINSVTATMFNQLEVALLGLTTAMLEDLVEAENVQTDSAQIFTTKTAEKLYTFYASRRTDFGELLLLTAEATCVFQRIRLFSVRQNTNTGLFTQNIFDVCERSRKLKWFGRGHFGTYALTCYGLPSEALVFFSAFDSVVVTAQVEMLYRELAATVEGFVVDLGGTISLNSGGQAPVLALLNKKQSAEFSLETWSSSANLHRSGCLDRDIDGIQIECIAWCRAELIMKACGCMPLISEFAGKFKALQVGFEICAGVDFERLVYLSDKRCGNVLAVSVEETKANCSRRCHKNCDTMLYSSTIREAENVSNQSLVTDIVNATTIVMLHSRRNVYMRVVEYQTMDERQLIVSLGGNLSLYLGASFLALIHIVVFLLKLPFDIAHGHHFASTQMVSQQSPV